MSTAGSTTPGATVAIAQRELAAYFNTPLALVFIVIFVALNGVLTFFVGGFYERGQADLQVFFGFHPWLYLFLVSALCMGLWAEERRSGTLELLLTQPVTLPAAVLAKFLAAWVVAGLALLLTTPVWLTVNYLGDPDNGVIAAGYVGSWLLAGGYIALGGFASALTRNQVIAFIIGVVLCFAFLLSGFPLVLAVAREVLPTTLTELLAATSFLTHFQAISKGVLDMRDLVYFGVMIVGWLTATTIVLDLRKAGS